MSYALGHRSQRHASPRRWALAGSAAFALAASFVVAGPARAEERNVLLEFHFQPVPNAQIAVWLETPEGEFVQDVFVTQATGTLGIGNRPGRWDFL